MQKIKYITNKDLLAEIKECKATYCHFTTKEYATYHAIVDLASITPELVAETITVMANKQSTKLTVVDPATIAPDSVVFRVMTDAHLPPTGDKNKRRETSTGEMLKTNFSPFRHFILQGEKLVEVGRSHWRGDFDTGKFSVVHGAINNRLAGMFMLLVEQYSRRGNWRGYCWRADHEILTQRGFLGIDEMNETDKVLSYHEGKLVWGGVKSIYRDFFDGQLFHLSVRGMEAFVTSGHKFITDNGMKPVEYLTEKDRIHLMGDPVADGDGRYSNAFVELVGWAVTEGSWYLAKSSNHYRITLYQNEGEKADRIRRCLHELQTQFSEYSRRREDNPATNISFALTKDISQQLDAVAPDRVLTMPFLLALTEVQRELLINTMVDGDGWRVKPYGRHNGGYMRYCQKDKRHVDAFLALCTMNGHRTTTRIRQPTPNKLVANGGECYSINIYSKTNDAHKVSMVENIDFHGGKRNGRAYPGGKEHHPNIPTFDYKGRVWCPETEYGTMIVRHGGTIFAGHNTYNDEMRSHALVQLSQVGLQFDESRSSNPFAFYTQIIKNCLAFDTMILTREHGSVAIGDVAEQDVTVLDGDGNWVKSHIYDYGLQETVNVNFSGGFDKVSIRSTLDHGWVQDGTGERIETRHFVDHNGNDTKNLRIADLRPSKEILQVDAYRRGVIHGIVYGDGSKYSTKDAFCIRLCGEKRELETWFTGYKVSYQESAGGDPIFYLMNIGDDLKALPDSPGESLDYLLGFMRGWLATDGCVSTEACISLCGDAVEFDWIKKWGPLVGWHTATFSLLAEQTNYGNRNKASGNMHFKKHSMDTDDFLRTKHLERWTEVTATVGRKPRHWRVYPGSQSRRQDYARCIERVYCPDVQTTHTVALACGIHTFQCFRRVLNLEHRSQQIRDDLLIMAGAMPSYTRQVENEIDQRDEPVRSDKPAKRGRKPKEILE